MPRVVGGGKDDSTVSISESDRHLSSRCGCEPDLHHIDSAGHQGPDDQVLNHRTGDASIPSNYNLVLFSGRLLLPGGESGAIGVGETDNINRREAFTWLPSNSSPDSGDRFNKAHFLDGQC